MKRLTFVSTLLLVAISLPLAFAQQPLPKVIFPYSLTQTFDSTLEHRAPEVPQGYGFEWVVSIGHKGLNHALGGHFCGGSVIQKRWVLTAAHCLTQRDNQGKPVPVPAGTIQIRTGYELHRQGTLYAAEKILIHEGYSVTAFNTLINDVALVKTNQDIVIHGTIDMLRPVNVGFIQDHVTVLGWGKPQSYLNYLSERLRYLALKIVTNDACNQNYYNGLIDAKMICALGEGTDACQGDSGGPLVALDANMNPSLFGVVSWGEQCGATLKPGIYASVPEHSAWIEQKMQSN